MLTRKVKWFFRIVLQDCGCDATLPSSVALLWSGKAFSQEDHQSVNIHGWDGLGRIVWVENHRVQSVPRSVSDVPFWQVWFSIGIGCANIASQSRQVISAQIKNNSF
ncbi:MAG: hypothetical protein K1Y36_21205 [Blastocatellia bacterium]|nr:hypothetical protein [Blastocatellia bacterium]